MTHQTFFKPRPRLLDKRQSKADVAKVDREENAKVKTRSGGQCEAWIYNRELHRDHTKEQWFCIPGRRCPLRGSHVHHLIGGIGRRNKGKSILAAHKLHVCERCHEEIHGHVLVPVDGTKREDAATVRYERIK